MYQSSVFLRPHLGWGGRKNMEINLYTLLQMVSTKSFLHKKRFLIVSKMFAFRHYFKMFSIDSCSLSSLWIVSQCLRTTLKNENRFLEEVINLDKLKVRIILVATYSLMTNKHFPSFINFWKFLTNVFKFCCKKCNILPSSNSLFRFCCQNYFSRPNTHFRPCFALLWGFLLEITPDPLWLFDFPVYQELSMNCQSKFCILLLPTFPMAIGKCFYWF